VIHVRGPNRTYKHELKTYKVERHTLSQLTARRPHRTWTLNFTTQRTAMQLNFVSVTK